MTSRGFGSGDSANFGDVANTAKGSPNPRNLVLVRMCRRRMEFITIINEVRAGTPPFNADLVDRVVKYVLDEGNSPLSVYEAATSDPFDCGHALGVIATTVAGEDFRPNARNRAKGCTCGTLLIPIACLPASINLTYTPEQNRDFAPADTGHFDLAFQDKYELAQTVLNGIQTRTVAWTFLTNKDGTYRLQAVIAYSHCLSVFGKLNPSSPPASWRKGATLTASEQIEILKAWLPVPSEVIRASYHAEPRPALQATGKRSRAVELMKTRVPLKLHCPPLNPPEARHAYSGIALTTSRIASTTTIPHAVLRVFVVPCPLLILSISIPPPAVFLRQTVQLQVFP